MRTCRAGRDLSLLPGTWIDLICALLFRVNFTAAKRNIRTQTAPEAYNRSSRLLWRAASAVSIDAVLLPERWRSVPAGRGCLQVSPHFSGSKSPAFQRWPRVAISRDIEYNPVSAFWMKNEKGQKAGQHCPQHTYSDRYYLLLQYHNRPPAFSIGFLIKVNPATIQIMAGTIKESAPKKYRQITDAANPIYAV